MRSNVFLESQAIFWIDDAYTDSWAVKPFRFATNMHNNDLNKKAAFTDRDRLSRAHKQGDYAVIVDTVCIAGTHTHRDKYDEVTKSAISSLSHSRIRTLQESIVGMKQSACV